MSSVRMRLAILFCATSLAACAGYSRITKAPGPQQAEDDETVSMSRQPFDEMEVCIDAWHELLVEWKENGGGLSSSIVDMRAQIAEDTHSRFSAMVRATWDEQRLKNPQPTRQLGAWPVPRSEEIAVGMAHTSVHNDDYEMPGECFSTVWLSPMLWDEIIVMKNGLAGPRPLEAPGSLVWESPYANYWTMHWLLRYVP